MADEVMQDAPAPSPAIDSQVFSPHWFLTKMQQPGTNGLELSTAARQPPIINPQDLFELLNALRSAGPDSSSTRGAAVSVIRPKTRAELALDLDNLRVATYLGQGPHCFNLSSAATVQRLTWIETAFHAHAASNGTAWPAAEQLPDEARVGREMAFWRACWERHHRPEWFGWRDTYLRTVVLMDDQPRWKYSFIDYRQLGGLPVTPPGETLAAPLVHRADSMAQQSTATQSTGIIRSVLASPPSSPVPAKKELRLPTRKSQYKPPGCSKRREMEKMMDLVDDFATQTLDPSLENAAEEALSGANKEEVDARIMAGLREGAGEDEESMRFAEEVWAKYKELSLEDGGAELKEEMGGKIEDGAEVAEEMGGKIEDAAEECERKECDEMEAEATDL